MAGFGAALRGQAPAPQPAAALPPGQQAPMPTDPALEEEQDLDGGEPASPEEQDMYNRFVTGGMLMLFDEKFVPQFKSMLDDGDLPGGIGEAVAQIGGRVASEAQRSQMQLPGDVIMHGTMELTEQAGELAEKLTDSEIDEPTLEAAYYKALERLKPIMETSGVIDEQGAAEDEAIIAGMQETGQWDELMAMIQQAQQGGSGRKMLEEAV